MEAPLSSIEIRRAFRQPLPPIQVTRGYRVRLAGVLLGLVVLQVLYLLLVAVAGALTWFSTLAAFSTGITPNFLTIVIYAGPPITGIIVTIFLLKPLIIRPRRPPQALLLRAQDEPALFEFVDSLCRALGSPRPSRIFVDLRVNASASIRRWRGFFLGHMDLTIGLPLAVGMTLPQFTGVLAHEFGHFAQRTGLRSYFLIQTIQNWFARVVNQRDKMDGWLDRQCRRRDWPIKGVAHVARFAVTGSRRYLALLMKAGAWISTAFSRQMEFDADRQEVAMVGVEVFEQTSRQITLLAVGASQAWQDVAQDWSVGSLPEDVPQVAVIRTQFLAQEAADRIVDAESNRATGRWDTHPSMADRIANARAAGFGGAFHIAGAPQQLFRDLPDLCRKATLHHYLKIMEVKDGAARLVPGREALANAESQREYEGAVQAFFKTTPLFCARWFRLPHAEPRLGLVEEPKEAAEGEEASFDAAAYDTALHTNLLHFAAVVVKQAGVAVNPMVFQLPAADLETIRRQESITSYNMGLALQHNRRSSKSIADRIEATVAQLLNGDLGVAVPSSRATEIPNLKTAWDSYGALSQFQPEVNEIRRCNFALQVVRENTRLFHAGIFANLIEDIESKAMSEIGKILSQVGNVSTTVTFDPTLPMTIGGQLNAASESRPERIQTFLARVDVLLARTLGHLAWFTLVACPMTKANAATETAV
jgi:Zn-dependent protease with chaperone function